MRAMTNELVREPSSRYHALSPHLERAISLTQSTLCEHATPKLSMRVDSLCVGWTMCDPYSRMCCLLFWRFPPIRHKRIRKAKMGIYSDDENNPYLLPLFGTSVKAVEQIFSFELGTTAGPGGGCKRA